MMVEEDTVIERSVAKDQVLTTSDSSTQTTGLEEEEEEELFSLNVPPGRRWADVGCGTSSANWSSFMDGWRVQRDTSALEGTPTLGSSFVGQLSSCDSPPASYSDETNDLVDNGYPERSHSRESSVKQEGSDWLENGRVIQKFSVRKDIRSNPEHTPSTSSIPELYPGLQKVFLKPVFSYACLIALALKHSPTKRLPVNEIYNYLQWEFPYFRTAPEGWKNSVRHNLSLNKAFYKVDRTPLGSLTTPLRPLSISGKGCYWLIDPLKEGVMDEEILKWKRKHPEAVRASMANPANYWNPPNTGLDPPQDHQEKGPSRPRYNPYHRSLRHYELDVPSRTIPQCSTIVRDQYSRTIPQCSVAMRDQGTESGDTSENMMLEYRSAGIVPRDLSSENTWGEKNGVVFPSDFI